jgi:hypothetical protein
VTGMSDTDVLYPETAERAVLGGLLLDPSVLVEVASLTASDFYNPHHATIFAAIREAVDSGEKVDQLVVMETLRSRGDLVRVGGAPFLHTCTTTIPSVANTGYYARFVRQAASRRKISDLGVRLQQAARSGDYSDALDLAAQFAFSALAIADESPEHAEDFLKDLHELREFVDQASAPFDWVIPGLLERMDRVIIVASEGAGKSTWMRAVATMLGQGIHPLNPNLKIPPKRSLIVDLENPPALIRRKSRHLVSAAEASGGWIADNVWLWSRPGGVNIRKSADAQLLDRLISHVRPALVCLGPLYKASLGGSDRGEQVAAETTAVLDRLREKHGCALWLEHHAPMAQNGSRTLRPIESGLWSRWPEFGRTLERDTDRGENHFRVGQFRRDRDTRLWPSSLAWGQPWPFEASWDRGIPFPLLEGSWDRWDEWVRQEETANRRPFVPAPGWEQGA